MSFTYFLLKIYTLIKRQLAGALSLGALAWCYWKDGGAVLSRLIYMAVTAVWINVKIVISFANGIT